MGRIFKNLIPYWKTVLVIIALLAVQAVCDLALPQYTSDIIDVGIQNSGVEHVLPDAVTEDEFELAQLFMTEDEAAVWHQSYDFVNGTYRCNIADRKKLKEADDELSAALILTYQMSMVKEDEFKARIAAQMNMDEDQVEAMSVEEIGRMLGTDINTHTVVEDDGKTEQVYVDMRTLLEAMKDSGRLQKDNLLDMRGSMEESFEAMGSSLTKSMGIAYAVRCDKEAGVDVDAIQTRYLMMSGLRMIGVALLMAVTAVFISFFSARVGAGVGRDLRGRLFKKVIGFSNAEMDKYSTASLITRTTNDVQLIQMVTAVMLRIVAYAPILGIGGVIKVVNTGAGMGWIIVLAVLVIFGLVMLLMAVAMPKFKLMQTLVDKVNLVSREILTGLMVIRAFRREEKEEERFDKANKELTKTNLFTNRVMTFMMPGMMLIMNALSVLIVWVAANKIDAGTLQVGAMTAFITYAMMIVMSFLMLTMMSIMLPRAAVAANRIDEVLKTDSSIKDTDSVMPLTSHNGVIEFDHVSFKYPGADEDVLSDISFTAEPGKTTAIIGSTGSGKSTLVNLIPRLYDVTSGSVKIDGMDIRDISLKDLRNEIGYVPQKGILFSGTIASNLRFGNEKASDEEIELAASIAQASDFIDEKQQKYDSPIAQGGTNVSGGQKQRLSIARAIVKKPKVFIFDDSFSALDLKTDAALRKALAKEVKESTVIIVAQRISTILNAEQIIVLDEGHVAGMGTHEYLLKNCEVYQQIARSQMSEKELGLNKTGKEVPVNEQ